jgi:peroxiredoxin
MRNNILRHILSLMVPVLLAANVIPALAEDAALAPTLKATDGAAAWTELTTGAHAPANPAKWKDTPPTAKEKQDFYLPFVHALAGRAKDFYTRFPKQENAGQAKVMEYTLLSMTVQWGDASQQSNVDGLAKSLLNDSSLPEKERMNVLETVAQNSPAEKARPLLESVVKGTGSADLKSAAQAQLDKMDAVGRPVDLKFTAVDGRSVDVSQLKGKVVLIDFWATWCGPCVGEVPNVKKTYDQFHSKGFEIVGISLDKDKDTLKKFTADHKMEWPQFFDGLFWQNKYAKQYGIESIPTMWLVDKKGKLRTMNAREDLEGGVQKLMAE